VDILLWDQTLVVNAKLVNNTATINLIGNLLYHPFRGFWLPLPLVDSHTIVPTWPRVIVPAKAGIHPVTRRVARAKIDSGMRRNDGSQRWRPIDST
jgi:hypothetical protein